MKNLILLTLLMSSSLFAATSADNRAEKTHEVNFQFGYDYLMFTGQFGYMFFLNPDNLLGVKVGSVKSDDEHQTNVSLQYQSYLGNSFYIAPEIYYLNSHEDVNGFIGSILRARDMADYTSLGAGIRIGNQWTWKVFTLGCDWIGVGQRMVTFKKETDRLHDTTVTLINFKIGASF